MPRTLTPEASASPSMVSEAARRSSLRREPKAGSSPVAIESVTVMFHLTTARRRRRTPYRPRRRPMVSDAAEPEVNARWSVPRAAGRDITSG
ncbi:hypothetical protein GCM10023080_073880 [Streptomyces pseudoechinosporeus]